MSRKKREYVYKYGQIDLTGRRFHRLTGLYKIDGKTWRFLCDCGKECNGDVSRVFLDRKKSCGCLRADWPRVAKAKHRKCASDEYRAWAGLKNRCLNKNNQKYSSYGGRGIRICDRWEKDFQAFFDDMGKKPSSKHSIDRIDNEGDYSPENCRWATAEQQSRNRRSNRLIEYEGEIKTLAEWADLLKINRTVLYARFKSGWSVERALTQPLRGKNGK